MGDPLENMADNAKKAVDTYIVTQKMKAKKEKEERQEKAKSESKLL